MQGVFLRCDTQQAAFVVYLLAIEVGVSSEWTSWASEGEHGEGDGDGHVHANLYKRRTHINKKAYITTAGLQI